MPLISDFNFKNTISLDDAEKFVELAGRAEHPHEPLHLDFSRSERIGPGAGSRIGNALRRYGDEGLLSVQLPTKFRDYLISKTATSSLMRSPIGHSISRYATKIQCDGQDILLDVRAHYEKEKIVVDKNFVFVRDLHFGTINVDDVNNFISMFVKWLPLVNIAREEMGRQDLASLCELCFEGIQNVYDHSVRSPFPKERAALTYFSMRYHSRIVGAPAGPLTGYLKRLRGISALNNMLAGFLEIVISDDGNGIPARQSQNSNIYWDLPLKQEDAFKKAMESGGSVKLAAKDAPIRGGIAGMGYDKIASALKNLNAYAAVRTGKLLASCDGTAVHRQSFRLFDAQGGSHGYMPGTLLEILVPIRSAKSYTGELFE